MYGDQGYYIDMFGTGRILVLFVVQMVHVGFCLPLLVFGRKTFAEHRTNILRQPCRRIYCADTCSIGKISVTLFIKRDRITPMLRNRNNTLLTLHILSALCFLSFIL